jgi:hypothetical protein
MGTRVILGIEIRCAKTQMPMQPLSREMKPRLVKMNILSNLGNTHNIKFGKDQDPHMILMVKPSPIKTALINCR